MNRFILGTLTSVALLGVNVGVGLTQASEENELRAMNQQLNDDVGQVKSSKADTLSQQFKVEPTIVENLRASKQGWGEIAIRLGMAQELMKVDPNTYPSMTEALQKVGDLRAQNMGWGAIAKSLDLKLGSIVREVRHAHNEIRKTERMENGRRAENVKGRDKEIDTRPEKALRTDKMDRVEKMDKVDKMERPERFDRVEKPMRPERPEKPERFK
jgi:hypothetical protein